MSRYPNLLAAASLLLSFGSPGQSASGNEAGTPAPPPVRVFSVHDLDGDGYLTRQEYEMFLQRWRQHRAASGRPIQDSRRLPHFDDIDSNGDQRLSEDELTALVRQRLHRRHRHGQR